MMRFALVVTMVLAIGAPVAAGPWEDGIVAYNQGDYATAVRLWLPLAEQGDASAQLNLGAMYSNGQGIPQDYIKAHKWYNLSASRFSASENEYRDMAAAKRDSVAAKMTPTDISKAQRLAREWQEHHQ